MFGCHHYPTQKILSESSLTCETQSKQTKIKPKFSKDVFNVSKKVIRRLIFPLF